jgi:hypothetical protein
MWTETGSLATARSWHTATLLPNGKVLVAGGWNGAILSSCELYDPSTGVWTATGSLFTARFWHTATLLPSGNVLAVGGHNEADPPDLSSCEIYGPSITVPGAPTGVTATPGYTQATVSFTAPASNGGSTITGYTVTSNPAGGVDSGAGTTSTTHVATQLITGTAYTFTVTSTNAAGTGPSSSPSNSVMPVGPPGIPANVIATPGNSLQR